MVRAPDFIFGITAPEWPLLLNHDAIEVPIVYIFPVLIIDPYLLATTIIDNIDEERYT